MRSATIVNVFGFAALAGVANAQTLVATMNGGPLERFGTAVVSAGFQDADTYADLLVGGPNAGGSVRCISGRFLATGLGPSQLWSATAPVVTSGFGTSIIDAGDLTGNSASDFVVGSPGYMLNPFSGVTNGALFLIDGSTHAVVATIYGFDNTLLGQVIVSVGDQNGDGRREIAATAPSTNGSASKVHIIQGSTFSGTKSLSAAADSSYNANGASDFGKELASGFDLDGNGKRDLAIGSPDMFGGGWMIVVSADDQYTTLASYLGTGSERMASSISASHDYNADGVVDFVVGAPGWEPVTHGNEVGRAVVLSGAQLRTFTLPYELAVFSIWNGFNDGTHHFGAAVRASADLNRDGVGDFLIGTPDFHSTFPVGPPKGLVFVYSGLTLSNIATIVGTNNDRLGDEILGALQDVDGDLCSELVVAGSTSDNPNTDCGVIKLYTLFPTFPGGYCTSKTNSLGCVPSISYSGNASASSPSPFLVTCSNVINQKDGLLMYSHAPHAGAFQGGTLCVKAPIKRMSPQNSGGSASGSDCTGTFSYDFNARIQSGVDPTLIVGPEIFCQFWARDPGSPSTTSLSNALRFLINP